MTDKDVPASQAEDNSKEFKVFQNVVKICKKNKKKISNYLHGI